MPVAEAVTARATLAKQLSAYAFFNPPGLYTRWVWGSFFHLETPMDTLDLFEIDTNAGSTTSTVTLVKEEPMDRAIRLISDLFDKRHVTVCA